MKNKLKKKREVSIREESKKNKKKNSAGDKIGKNYLVSKETYNSFSLYCSTIGRFFDPEELDYVELYLSFNESDS